MAVDRINKGQEIKAKFLNSMADGIDDLTEEFANRPEDQAQVLPPEVQGQDPEASTSDTFDEISRTTSLVQVFDQEEVNYAEIERIETVTLVNADGRKLILRFNN